MCKQIGFFMKIHLEFSKIQNYDHGFSALTKHRSLEIWNNQSGWIFRLSTKYSYCILPHQTQLLRKNGKLRVPILLNII